MLIDGQPREAEQQPDQDDAGGRNTKGLREQMAQWVPPTIAAVWMNILIAVVAVATVVLQGYMPDLSWPPAELWGLGAFKLFALWCLSFLPGWLYIRFLGFRAGALWTEYVLNLHRLGYDHPGYLPEPPRDSEPYTRWAAHQRRIREDQTSEDCGRPDANIYRQKFDAYYGRQVAEANQDESDFRIRIESLFPVFLTTAVLAVGWAVILWDTAFLTTTTDAFGVLKFAFLGAYTFIVGVLVRRFYQSDLRPSAYASAVVRIMTVLLTMAALHVALFLHAPPVVRQGEVAVAFLVGVIPLTALEALRRIAASGLKSQLPQVAPNYPLNHLDGLNIWYEARLNEEGVEDMQNLTTMNLVDVILHTRVPVGRLVDWVDQAFLLVHLDHASADELKNVRKHPIRSDDNSGAATRVVLRRMGIRTATDLLAVFSTPLRGSDGSPPKRKFAYRECPIDEHRLHLLVDVLRHERGLMPLWNWRSNGSPYRPPRQPARVDDSTDGLGHDPATSANGAADTVAGGMQAPATSVGSNGSRVRLGHFRLPMWRRGI